MSLHSLTPADEERGVSWWKIPHWNHSLGAWFGGGEGEGFQERIWSDPARKPNSWAFNFVDVFRHNPEDSQTWGFCMDFLNQKEGGMLFLLSPLPCTVTNWKNCNRLREFEEIEVSYIAKVKRWLWIERRKTLKTFVWILFKKSASAQGFTSRG